MIYTHIDGRTVVRTTTVVPVIGLSPSTFHGYHPWLRTRFWTTLFVPRETVDAMTRWIDARMESL